MRAPFASISLCVSLCLLAAACGTEDPRASRDHRANNGAPTNAAASHRLMRPPALSPQRNRTEGCIADVPAAFSALRTEVEPERYLSARNDGVVPWPRYSDTAENNLGVGEHFQGIQRVGQRLLVSGGVKNGSRTSQIILIDMATRDATASWTRADLMTSPRIEDRIVATVDLDATLWHAGGIQVADDVLAVALEGENPDAGELRFYDANALTELGPRITRDHKLYAAGLTRMLDGRFLALTWDDARIELFRSNSATLGDGVADAPLVIDPLDVDGGFAGGGCGTGCGTYQALNLVRACNGELFIVGTRNTEKLAPSIPGENLASLYALTLDDTSAHLAFVARRTFGCHDRQCNFAAASGVAVLHDEAGNAELAIYSAYHWLQDSGSRLLFNEFSR